MIIEDLKVNLLVVEDDIFIRKIYNEILCKIDKVEITEHSSAEEAIESLKDNKPDLVIMDYRLPGMDGLEATKQIIMAYPDSIVLVVTGDENKELEEEMLEVGAVSFLKKPIRGKLLYFTIQNFVEIILSKKKLKIQADEMFPCRTQKKIIMETVSSSAGKSIADSDSHKKEKLEKSDQFIDTFSNNSLSGSAEKFLNESSDAKDSITFFSEIDDVEYMEDFIDAADELIAFGDTLLTVVESDLLLIVKDVLHKNSMKLEILSEFPTIAYTLKSISEFMDVSDISSMSDIPMKKLAVFLSDFINIYSNWVKDVFVNRDAQDIHFMDIEIMSFGLQMDSIFSDVNVLSEDDESAVDEGSSVEFF